MNTPRHFIRYSLLAAIVAICIPAHAQVPQLIHYQSRVAVGGVNFEGGGLFKFALVNTNGSTTYWSNDGTSTAGSEPTAAVTLPVTKGLYSVHLGDTALANMTAIPASVFTNDDVRLRVWFNDGVNGSQLLTPDHRIAAVGYAMMAGTVPDGSITAVKIGDGAITNSKIALGTISSDKLASGGTAFSFTPDDTALLNQGYLQIQSSGIADLATTGIPWPATSTTDAPSGRQYHTTVWTGSEMIVWGGGAAGTGFTINTWFDSGGRYNPVTNAWNSTPLLNAPNPRSGHTAVWTGTEMIVWGGVVDNTSPTYFNTGARFNPETGVWTSISTANAPSGRADHSAVWTGTEMIIYGGYSGGFRNDGARYNPSTDVWTPITSTNAPSVRAGGICSVWTGSEMIVFGGGNGSITLNTGGRYNPVTDTWVATSLTNAPQGRSIWNGAVWSGTEMIIWAGSATGGAKVNTGGRYNPATNSWTTMSVTGAPVARDFHSLVWTGSELMVFGGSPDNETNIGGVPINSGGRYNPATNSWLPISSSSPPTARRFSQGVWTGGDMIVWGGNDGSNYLSSGGRSNPASAPTEIYLYIKQ